MLVAATVEVPLRMFYFDHNRLKLNPERHGCTPGNMPISDVTAGVFHQLNTFCDITGGELTPSFKYKRDA